MASYATLGCAFVCVLYVCDEFFEEIVDDCDGSLADHLEVDFSVCLIAVCVTNSKDYVEVTCDYYW